jgi:hypothetical protein
MASSALSVAFGLPAHGARTAIGLNVADDVVRREGGAGFASATRVWVRLPKSSGCASAGFRPFPNEHEKKSAKHPREMIHHDKKSPRALLL